MGGVDYASLVSIPTSYATCSLGSPSNPPPLLDRLHAISLAGFPAVELSFPDILSFGQAWLSHQIEPSDYDELCKVAAEIKKECDKRSLGIMMLQPFANFEGWPEGSEGRNDALDRARGWIRIMQACGTDMLQVGSTDTPLEKLEKGKMVSDLRGLCDMLKEHGFRLAYENWCWSTHAPDWKDVWSIVKEVDRPNIGLCLDTFQTAGGEWADPRTPSGLLEDVTKDELEKRFKKSLDDLSTTVPKDKIYLLQISDGYRAPEPFHAERDGSGLLPRGRWSHDFRPLPYNGGYLPVVDVATAVLKTGFRGWFSYEVFDGGADGKKQDVDIVAYAMAAKHVQPRLLAECAGERVPER
ncbi:xylose isomerase-like protein [Cucurbitaria berberidis CBS 394.84]|uniref:Xylose isomerase-like protein n=1 Tax=Cucurbitaria berberidis CBS 394.84 TaxID=1168544 RepID=A0A9P4GI85_9PLEO|nr:xylose isomerase-like protein [Cucurbitaria berberidis CBS 394.84]KAF1845709.1 xylose isomerase-like protein [Cucurbitaria berberidis CBS 394.84]